MATFTPLPKNDNILATNLAKKSQQDNGLKKL